MMKISEHTAALEAKAAAKPGQPRDDSVTRHDTAFLDGAGNDYRYAARVTDSGFLALRMMMKANAAVIYDLTDDKLIKYMPETETMKHGISNPPTFVQKEYMRALPVREG